MMKSDAPKDIDAIFADGRAVDEAVRDAFREAVRDHLKTGRPLVIWRDGAVQLIPPSDLLDDNEAA
jgi:hypothetical protein